MRVFNFILILFGSTIGFGQTRNYVVHSFQNKYYADSIYFKSDSICLVNKTVQCLNNNAIVSYQQRKLINYGNLRVAQKIYDTHAVLTEFAQPTVAGSLYFRYMSPNDIKIGYSLNKAVQLEVGNTLFTTNSFNSFNSLYIGFKIVEPLYKDIIHFGLVYNYQMVTDKYIFEDYPIDKMQTLTGMLTFGKGKNIYTLGCKYEKIEDYGNSFIYFANAKLFQKEHNYLILEYILSPENNNDLGINFNTTSFAFCNVAKSVSYSIGLAFSTNDKIFGITSKARLFPFINLTFPFKT